MATLNEARAAKKKVIAEITSKIPNAATGISGNKEKGYSVAVRLQTAVDPGTIPDSIDGVPIESEVIGIVEAL